jgi:hypothetical protein
MKSWTLLFVATNSPAGANSITLTPPVGNLFVGVAGPFSSPFVAVDITYDITVLPF